MPLKPTILLSFLFLLLIAGCGTPGAPQPPSLRLPKPVEDLTAVRRGDKVYLSFTAPTRTTDDAGLREPVTLRLCRHINVKSNTCDDVASEQPLKSGAAKIEMVDDLVPILQHGGRDLIDYQIEARNPRGRSAGLSNSAPIFLAPGITAPADLRAAVQADGVHLQWRNPAPPVKGAWSPQYELRLYRTADAQPKRPASMTSIPLAGDNGDHLDTNFEWEQGYRYWLTVNTRLLRPDGSVMFEFESEPTAPASVLAHDIFPPAAPQGLQAAYSTGGIDLSWSPNGESDLAGYNIYRSDRGIVGPVRINAETVKAPGYRDEKVTPGMTYTYTVTAVDARGNESGRSSAATETTPN